MDTAKTSIDTQEKPKSLDQTNTNTDQENEIGGFENRPEPTRFGDWEVNGRCSDF